MNFFTGISTCSMFYTQKKHAHACILYKMYGHPRTLGAYTDVGDYTGQTCLHAVPGRVHGGWALFRMGVISGFYGIRGAFVYPPRESVNSTNSS